MYHINNFKFSFTSVILQYNILKCFMLYWLQATLAAVMTEKSPFTTPIGRKDEADLAKSSIALAVSDHLTIYNAYLGWVIFSCSYDKKLVTQVMRFWKLSSWGTFFWVVAPEAFLIRITVDCLARQHESIICLVPYSLKCACSCTIGILVLFILCLKDFFFLVFVLCWSEYWVS